MAHDPLIILPMSEACDACKNEPDLIKRIAKAMRATKNHYMVTNDDTCFKAALGAVLLETADEAEKARLMDNLTVLKYLSAMLSGIQVSPEAFERAVKCVSPEDAPSRLLPLTKMWEGL